MPQPQKGVCAEPNLHALYLLFNVHSEDSALVRAKLPQLLDTFAHFDEEHYEGMVSGVVAVGASYWLELYPGQLPKELAPFPDFQCDDRRAPSVPFDLFVQLRADRADVCFAMGQQVMALLQDVAEVVEQIQGFRYLDGRDLMGFVDGDSNPRGMQKLDVAIVGDQDPEFAGGSYIHVQRFRHLTHKWQLLSEDKQAQVIGRDPDGKPLDPGRQRAYAHAQRVQLLDANGQKMQILRQSMPYGDMRVQGSFFVSCAASPEPFTRMLENMIMEDSEGHYDRLWDFTQPDLGAAFFAPSVNFLKLHAGN